MPDLSSANLQRFMVDELTRGLVLNRLRRALQAGTSAGGENISFLNQELVKGPGDVEFGGGILGGDILHIDSLVTTAGVAYLIVITSTGFYKMSGTMLEKVEWKYTDGTASVVSGNKNVVGSTVGLGTEKVVNGLFTTDTVWTKGTGITIHDNAAWKEEDTEGDLSQDVSVSEGKTYRVTVTYAVIDHGPVKMKVGGTDGIPHDIAGTYTEDIIAINTGVFMLSPDGEATTYKITSVSVREVTTVGTRWLSNVRAGDSFHMTAQCSAYPIETVSGDAALSLFKAYPEPSLPNGKYEILRRFAGSLDKLVMGAPFRGNFAFTNGVDLPQYWDGSSVALSTFGNCPATCCKVLVVWADRIIMFNTIESGENYPRRARWSAAGSLVDWTGEGSGYTDLEDMPGEVLNAIPLAGTLVVFKSDSIIHVRRTGIAAVPFEFAQTAWKIGLIGPGAVAKKGEEGCFFLGDDRQVYEYDRFKIEAIGTNVKDSLFETVNPIYYKRIRSVCIEEWNEWWVLVCTGSASVPDTIWIYNFTEAKWCPIQKLTATTMGFWKTAKALTWADLVGTWNEQLWEWNSASVQEAARTILMGIPSGEVRKIDMKLKMRGGSSFEAFWDTADIDMSEYNPALRGMAKIITRIRIFYRNFGVSCNLIVQVSNNGGATWSYERIVNIAGGASGGLAGQLQISNADFLVPGESFRIRIKETGTGTNFAIDHLEIQFAISGQFVEWSDGSHL